jgi:outer membrane protein assembly complex protein YaeT
MGVRLPLVFLTTLVTLTASLAAQEPSAAKYIGQPIRQVALVIEGQPSTEPALLDLVETRQGRQLSMADVRETITHFASLGRFENVLVDAESATGGGVNLRYSLEPVHGVSRVDFHGSLGVSEGTLRQWLTDRFGATPSLGRASDIATTFEEIYFDNGYPKATVKAAPPVIEHNPDRTILVFDVNAGPEARVANVSLQGTLLDTKEQVLERIGVAPGRPYRRPDLQKKLADYVTRMRRRGYYQATATDQPPTVSDDGTQVDLVIDIAPGPLVKIQYQGDPLPKDKLNDLVPIEREGSLDEDLLEDSSRRIEQYLQQQGYYKSHVTHELQRQENTLTVVFHVQRDGLYHVAPGATEITGNQSIPIEEFKSYLRLAEGEPFVSSKLDAAVGAIKELYLRRGFPNVDVKAGANQVSEGLIKPTIVITEGRRVLTGTLSFDGNTALRNEELQAAIKTHTGDPFYAPAIDADREAIRRQYLNTGYASAQVTAVPTLVDGGTHANLAFKIQEGPQTIVDHILIVGNTRTDPSIIRRELQLHEGEPLGLEAIAESHRRLTALGLFRRVRIATLPHGSPTNPDVIVTVEEALRTSIGYGGGAEIDRVLTEGPNGEAEETVEFAPRGFFEIGRRNLGGKNRSVNLYTRLSLRPNSDPDDPRTFGFAEYRVVGTYREPKAAHGLADFTATIASEQARRTSFNFARKGINLEVTRRISGLIRTSTRYSLGTTRTFDEKLDEQDELTIDRLFPQVRISAFSEAVVRDTRNDLLEPHQGTLMSVEGSLAARAIGSEVGFTKAFLQGFYYHPVGRPNLIFAGGVRLGLAHPFPRETEQTDADGNTTTIIVEDLPASERFFAGGDTTIRGYALDSVGTPATISPEGFPIGGNALVVLNAELRAPVWRDVGAAFFIDGGNVFAKVSDFDLGELRGGIGFGLRYKSPIGPIRLDLGFKMDRRVIGGRLEPRTALHFSIGQAF